MCHHRTRWCGGLASIRMMLLACLAASSSCYPTPVPTEWPMGGTEETMSELMLLLRNAADNAKELMNQMRVIRYGSIDFDTLLVFPNLPSVEFDAQSMEALANADEWSSEYTQQYMTDVLTDLKRLLLYVDAAELTESSLLHGTGDVDMMLETQQLAHSIRVLVNKHSETMLVLRLPLPDDETMAEFSAPFRDQATDAVRALENYCIIRDTYKYMTKLWLEISQLETVIRVHRMFQFQ